VDETAMKSILKLIFK